MRRKAEHILTGILIVLVLPCVLTFLLGNRMDKIYRTIKNEAQYISVKTNSGTLEMSLEEYVIGVTAAQIPLTYDLEAVKCQMVIARTNLYRQIAQSGEVPQEAYLTMEELERAGAADKFLKAQRQTKNEILTWRGEPVMASFHAISAGRTRDAGEVFLSGDYPYLQSKVCPSDETAPGCQSVIQIDEAWRDMEIVERDSAGYVQKILIDGDYLSGEEFRNLLGLPSSAFEVERKEDGVFLVVHGVGHGIGLSQYTAQQLALADKNYKEILDYFYPGTEMREY